MPQLKWVFQIWLLLMIVAHDQFMLGFKVEIVMVVVQDGLVVGGWVGLANIGVTLEDGVVVK